MAQRHRICGLIIVAHDPLESIINDLRVFVSEREWERFHDPKNLAMALVSEAGELAAEYRWVRNDESDSWSRERANLDRVSGEVADVGIALLLFCDRVGINLASAMRQKIAINRRNYPADRVKGTAERPTLNE